ncbi:MAG: sterol desaturase family protein [Pseudomonadota bacterium]|nr:sterol desaturase family protein [Pseudomonadota bacterium]
MNPIVYAIPVFFLLMAIEIAVARARRRSAYRLADSINSVSLGTMSQVAGVFTRLLSLGIYVWIYEQVRLFDLPATSILIWIGALVAYDFLYYWHHRLGHEVNILWAAHVVHHQSEEFNLSTALRQTSSGFLLGWVFYLPMAVAGVPPLVFASVALIDLLYQYWIHTEQIGRLGWFDRVFASPSNHRVHHGVNDQYVDKNYGGILIVWDRLFGTFQDERADDPVVYGTRAPLRSWNPLRANLDTYFDLARDSWHARRWGDKLRVWIARPGWRPNDVALAYPKPAFAIERVRKYDTTLTIFAQVYCLLQFIAIVAAGTHFLAILPMLNRIDAGLYALFVLASLWILGGLLEARPGFRWLELIRLLSIACGVSITGHWFGNALSPALSSVIAFALVASGLAAMFGLRLAQRGIDPIEA